MILYPFLQLFMSTLLIRTLLALSSHHWPVIWLALELNIISFIPLIASSNWHQEHEARLKYLIFQALGSSLLLLFSFNPSISSLLIVALRIKLGVAPFHFWFPSVIKRVSWNVAALLITWQKIAPMSLIISFFQHKRLLCLIGVISALIGGIGGINQTHLRPLLAYSSIGHIGWIIAGTTFSPSSAFLYFIIYLIISIRVVTTCLLSNISLLKNTLNPQKNIYHKLLIPTIISLGGLPPFAGFIPKLLLLTTINRIFVPLVLLISSLINLTYYLNFIFTSYLSKDQIKKNTPSSSFPLFLTICAWVSISPLPIMLFITLLI